MSPILRTLLLWGGSRQCLWTGHYGVPLQGLPLRRGQYLWHQCWSYAISGKCDLYSNAQRTENAFMLAQLFIQPITVLCPFFPFPMSNVSLLSFLFFSGSTRWAPVRALRWATNCGFHASCCIVWVKILVLLWHLTQNQWRATGTALVATLTSAPSRWGKKEDYSE